MAAAEEVSTEELLRQMSLARQAVEHARQQAQLHVSAVLQGNEERLGALHSALDTQQAEDEEREAVAQCFQLWAALPAHNSRADARAERAVAHARRWSTQRCLLAWRWAVLTQARQAEAGLQARLDLAMRQLAAVPGARGQLAPSPGQRERPGAAAAPGTGLVVELTQEAQREMQATTEDLEASLQQHSVRQADAKARHVEVRSRLPSPPPSVACTCAPRLERASAASSV